MKDENMKLEGGGIFADRLRKKGYKINKLIMFIFVAIIPFLLLLSEGLRNGFDKRYTITCPDKGQPCKNVYYQCDIFIDENCPDEATKTFICSKNPGFCTMAILPPGFTTGSKESFTEKYYLFIVIFFGFLGYIINHFWYNTKDQRIARINNLKKLGELK